MRAWISRISYTSDERHFPWVEEGRFSCPSWNALITHDDRQVKYCFKTTSNATPPLLPFEVLHLDEEQK
jgi:hypothetical protein